MGLCCKCGQQPYLFVRSYTRETPVTCVPRLLGTSACVASEKASELPKPSKEVSFSFQTTKKTYVLSIFYMMNSGLQTLVYGTLSKPFVDHHGITQWPHHHDQTTVSSTTALSNIDFQVKLFSQFWSTARCPMQVSIQLAFYLPATFPGRSNGIYIDTCCSPLLCPFGRCICARCFEERIEDPYAQAVLSWVGLESYAYNSICWV